MKQNDSEQRSLVLLLRRAEREGLGANRCGGKQNVGAGLD